MTRLKGKARAKANRKKKNKQKNDFFLKKKNLIGEIRKYDDPVLEAECSTVPDGEDVKDIFKKMTHVLNATDNGVGLAAPQVGITKRILVVKPDSNSANITCMINPEIIEASKEKKYGREGCLSYPNTFGMVERHVSLKVSYFDQEWKKHIKGYKEGDILGIAVQHEMEHLQEGHCQIHDWWKDPEAKQKELEERFKFPQEQSSKYEVQESEGYEIEESEDYKREREEEERVLKEDGT